MITVSVSLPKYLAQWAANRFDHVKDNDRIIITPLKGSPMAQFLRNFLKHKRIRPVISSQSNVKGAVDEGVDEILIAVPHFPGRDPQYYNYLSPVAEAQLRDLMRSIFDIQLFTEFARFENINIPVIDFIYSWLDANGIDPDETNWLAVDKRLQLLRRRAADRKRKSKKKVDLLP